MNVMLDKYDYIIIGAGITGLAIARELIDGEPDATVLIVDKETGSGAHGSGRNSGVLHSGIYYDEHSLKAKVCADGAKELAQYCDDNNLPIDRMGKVIVPVREADDPQVDLLYHRGKANGANVSIIDRQQLKEIEPEAATMSGRALHSPDTAVIDPLAVLEQLVQELTKKGVEIQYSSPVLAADPDNSTVHINGRNVRYNQLFNATGQFADHIASMFGVGSQYTLLPFKGIYYALDEQSNIHLNGLVYPVPDLEVPFLGVHSVRTIQGKVYLGPTAVPAFGRENYNGLRGIEPGKAISISYQLAQQYVRNNQGFRKFTHDEAGRFLKTKFVEAAKMLIPRLRKAHLQPSDKVGIRAQLLNKQSHELVMDFLVERKDNTVHILNAVSPAFTSAFAFARHVIRGR